MKRQAWENADKGGEDGVDHSCGNQIMSPADVWGSLQLMVDQLYRCSRGVAFLLLLSLGGNFP